MSDEDERFSDEDDSTGQSTEQEDDYDDALYEYLKTLDGQDTQNDDWNLLFDQR